MKSTRFRALAAGALALGAGLLPARGDGTLEYAVKAAYLVKFIPFIEWPDNAFPGPGAPLNICILGPDPFGAALDRAAAGQRVGDHALSVRRIESLDPLQPCQIVFAGGSDALAASDMVEALKTRPVLTVTDSGVRAHGVIAFVVADNHVRFDIDDAQAGAEGLTISSKLLDLARNVRRKGAAP